MRRGANSKPVVTAIFRSLLTLLLCLPQLSAMAYHHDSGVENRSTGIGTPGQGQVVAVSAMGCSEHDCHTPVAQDCEHAASACPQCPNVGASCLGGALHYSAALRDRFPLSRSLSSRSHYSSSIFRPPRNS